MITLRKSKDRGHFDHAWLKTHHTFSFSEYQDSKHMNFRSLRVINEDYVAPADGFDTHGHRDMEIITYILEGSLEHKDSMGIGSVIKPGDVQKMSAGTGVQHSEFNASKTDWVHLLQIWIIPRTKGIAPNYSQFHFSRKDRLNQLCLVGSGLNKSGAAPITQDVEIFATILESGKSIDHTIGNGRGIWIQVAKGTLEINGIKLDAGDGAAIEGESKITMTTANANATTEFLLFDLG